MPTTARVDPSCIHSRRKELEMIYAEALYMYNEMGIRGHFPYEWERDLREVTEDFRTKSGTEEDIIGLLQNGSLVAPCTSKEIVDALNANYGESGSVVYSLSRNRTQIATAMRNLGYLLPEKRVKVNGVHQTKMWYKRD